MISEIGDVFAEMLPFCLPRNCQTATTFQTICVMILSRCLKGLKITHIGRLHFN